ncbi:MAG: hypothetical protein AAGA03_06165 [Planctomycetota bacterium]
MGRSGEPGETRPCVLLTNGRVLFGNARQVADSVLLERQGSTLKLNRNQVACWADSLLGLYQFRVDGRQGDSLSQRWGDATWCLENGLLDQAEVEIAWMEQRFPSDPRPRRLRSQLQTLRTASSSPNRLPEAPAQSQHSVRQTASQQPWFDEARLELASDSPLVQRFARHVQPMLVNHCGTCHRQNSGRSWSLLTTSSRSRPSARMTRANLSSVIRWQRQQSEEQDNFLRLATTAHGGSTRLLRPGSAAATNLQYWLQLAEQMLSPQSTQGAGEAATADQTIRQVTHTAGLSSHENQGAPTEANQSVKNSVPGQPRRLPAIGDPFDPDLFNRQFNPRR